MDLVLATAGQMVRTAGRLSPRWGAALALPLFAHVARPRPVHPDDRSTMEVARRSAIRIPGVDRRGVDLAVYEWGHGTNLVVLAHGWNGRASQFATLVRELVSDGWHVVAFDAPAHGESDGRGTYLVDWIDALAALQRSHGRIHSVIGHSFGGLATLVAIAEGVQADRVVTIAAPGDADLLLAQFRTMLGYDERTSAALRERFAARYFPGESDPFARLSPLRRALPPSMPLLAVHDEGDRIVPFGELARIAAAQPTARTVTTRGFGHNLVLTADPVLDAIVAFVGERSTILQPHTVRAAN
ncbi:alpha/beta fold hydrolase [Microbacterium sp. SSM24]|uniref:alpha/beta fold hydrolase n=1 Tax=Microbacterium sp. SSM24 TaxID=2991714 RepID=UPI002227C92E|nr:alpha/beta hydrolase [Microbacterium sp. SSM24]MCW3492832.1 alpha/beta hydrolase [Microbacterium sp. SSM24]